MKALKRLMALLGLSVASFLLISVVMNYLFLFLETPKLIKAEGIPDNYYQFKIEYLYTSVNEEFDVKMTAMISFMVAMLLFWKLSKSLYLFFRKTPEVKGSTKWATIRDIKKDTKNFYECDTNNLATAEQSGIILCQQKNKLYVDTQTINSLIIGTTRSGKGQTFVLPMIRVLSQGKMRQSMIMNDPKGELIENSYQMLKDRGYKVVILNFRDTNLSSLWNPLSPIIREYKKAMESDDKDLSIVNDLISDLAMVFTDNPKSDPIWPTSAKSLLSAIIMLLLGEGYKNDCLDKLNMYSVYSFFLEFGSKNEMINGKPVNALDKLFQQLPVGDPAKLSYATSNFATGDMRSSIFSTLSSNLEIFSDTGIAKLTSGDEIIFEDLINPDKPCAIFMVVPDEKTNRHILASLFVNQCYSELVTLASSFPGQKLPQRIQFILDEFGNMVRIPAFDTKITVSLGRNILFNLFVQDLQQLKTKYDDASGTIRSNCGNIIYINSLDKETNEYISNVIGYETVEYDTLSGDLSESLSHQNISIEGKPLMRSEDLPRMEFGSAIIIKQRFSPIKTKFTPFYELKIPVTPIASIIEARKYNLTDVLFPFDKIQALSSTLTKVGNERKEILKKADELTNYKFVEAIQVKNFTLCKQFINGFYSSGAFNKEELDILVNLLRQFEEQQ